MDTRLTFRDCTGDVITKRGRSRLAESADGLADLRTEGERAGKSTRSAQAKPEVRDEGLLPHKVREVTLPRKAAKESSGQPYPKPTQVDEVNIHRRLREHSLRN
jgi:hypothetical protein